MRISKLIQIGRFEGYVGYRPNWSTEERRTERWPRNERREWWGRGFWWGHWTVLLCWTISKREYARRRAEWLAKFEAELDALERAEAARSWPARQVP